MYFLTFARHFLTHNKTVLIMRLLTMILAFSMFLLTCKDEEVPRACEVENFGLFGVKNSTGEDVDVWIDDVYQGELKNGTTKNYIIAPGFHEFYAEEADAWFPEEWEKNFTIDQCEIQETQLVN